MAQPRSLARRADILPRRFAVAGGELAALHIAPTAPARGTALLVPGFTGSKEDFLALLPLLADAGFEVVALDLRGQYESGGLPAPDGFGPDALARDVLAVVHQLDGPVHLLGHSFGGLVAQAAARADAGALASLTLLCSGPGRLPDGDRVADTELLLSALPGLSLEQAWEVKLEREGPVDPGAAGEFLRTRWLATTRESYLGMAHVLLTAEDEVDALARATRRLPVLVLHGALDDAWRPAQQAEMARRLGARYVVLEDAAHSPNYEDPEGSAAVLVEHWTGSDTAGYGSVASAG